MTTDPTPQEVKLLPCPFCGNKCTFDRGVILNYAGCAECNIFLSGQPRYVSEEELARRWNTRATQPESEDGKLKLAITEASSLIGYADTVRMDRKDETGEFALQTVDWCEGLLEYSDRAKTAIDAAIRSADKGA